MILFGAGHSAGEKVYKGYNEDKAMFDLAERKARYAADRYGQKTKTFYMTGKTWDQVEAACRGCRVASWEHSNAWEPDPTIDRVSVYRTVKNKGNGPCLLLGQATVKVLGVSYAEVKHKANSKGNDHFGVIGRAMKAGCKDSWLHEHSFHTNDRVRGLLSDPAVRQKLAEAEVDVLAKYYGWESGQDMFQRGDKGLNIYVIQSWLKSMGYNLGEFKDYQTGKATGCDGSFGPAMQTLVNQIRKEHGLAQTGVVDGALIAKLQTVQGGDCSALELEIAGLTAELKTEQGRMNGVRAALDTLRSVRMIR